MIRMLKKALLILLTAATVLCALEVTAQMGVGDHRLPHQEWLLALVGAVVVSTVLLWLRLRGAVVLAVASYLAFGCYQAGCLRRCSKRELLESCCSASPLPYRHLPFLAATAAALCGPDRRRKSQS